MQSPKIRKSGSSGSVPKQDNAVQVLPQENGFNEIFMNDKDSSGGMSIDTSTDKITKDSLKDSPKDKKDGKSGKDKKFWEIGRGKSKKDKRSSIKIDSNINNINNNPGKKQIGTENTSNKNDTIIDINDNIRIDCNDISNNSNDSNDSNDDNNDNGKYYNKTRLKEKDPLLSLSTTDSTNKNDSDSVMFVIKLDSASQIEFSDKLTGKKDTKLSYNDRIAKNKAMTKGDDSVFIDDVAIELDVVKPKKLTKDVVFDSDCTTDSNSNDDPIPLKHDKGIILKQFHDYRPLAKQYFSKPPGVDDGSERDGLAVIIPFFNEPSHELQQTLNSLHSAFIELKRMSKKWRDKNLYIILIQDGWHKADKTTQIYLKNMFPKKINGTGWWEYFPEFHSDFKDSTCNATFIFERKNYAPSMVNLQDDFANDRNFMKITLMIKINNRRKHNSHEWFLAKTGFAEAVNAKYLFLTDAFTFYSKKCLYYLVNELDKDNNLSSVTGRQRLMTRGQQGSGESVFSFGFILRSMQLYDFELANAVYNGAFHMGGLLPVIPGPCGLYRASDLLQDNVRNSYFNVVNEEPSKTGLVLGNLRIAEDRILSYYSVIKTSEQKRMAFNPLAVFYFEAETDLEKFILQRRRWINGSVAGYIYLLFQNFQDFREWDAPFYRKTYIWILLMCQFLIYCMVAIAPGILLRTLYYGLRYFLEYYNVDAEIPLILVFIGLWFIYICHVYVHYHKKFNYIIMYILSFLSIITSVVSFGSLIHYAFVDAKLTFLDIALSKHPVLYMAAAVLLFPFFLSVLLSGRGHSFMYMIKSFVQYTLFIPLLIGWFGSYAYSRIWDLTWGNRPANELNDITADQKEIMVTKFKEKTARINIVIAIVNILVFCIPLQGQLVLMGIFFGIALYQMFFSLIFCLSKIPYKCKMGYRTMTRDKSYNPVDSEV